MFLFCSLRISPSLVHFAAPGIEQESLRTPYEILVDELPGKYHAKLAVVSGPSFAKEIGVAQQCQVTFCF